jgi:NADPH:quinone reductase-like Zn-dependent oxidoreductase
MKAVLHRKFGGPDVLEVVDAPDPRPGHGDVAIRVRATALNRLDVLQRAGPALLPGFSLPHIAGMDVVGEVAELGHGVDGLAAGDRVVVNPAVHCGRCERCRSGDDRFCPDVRVVGGNHAGGYAELCVVPATHVHHIPDTVSYEEAVTVPTIWSTAWHGLVTVGELRIGEWVMIHAAASGVSTAAIQLAKRMGARVLATAGSDRKLEVARKLGADLAVNNRTDDFVAAAKEVTGGDGIDMVFDHVGPALFQPSLFALRPRGRMIFCGVTTGNDATFNLSHAYHFGIQLLGADPYSYAEFGDMLDYYWSGGFQPVIDCELPLEQVAQAHRKMESDDLIGKIILRP